MYDDKIKNSETYGIVPDFVLYDNDLTLIELKTYIQVNKLSNKKGYCYASNERLAEYLSCSKTSIINAINKLVDKRYLEKRMNYWEGTEGVKNKILIPIKPTGSQVEVTTSNEINDENILPSQVDDTTLVNSSLPPSQVEVTRPSQVDDTHNNISEQNNNNSIREHYKYYDSTSESLIESASDSLSSSHIDWNTENNKQFKSQIVNFYNRYSGSNDKAIYLSLTDLSNIDKILDEYTQDDLIFTIKSLGKKYSDMTLSEFLILDNFSKIYDTIFN